ncbi:MAG: hypothetical protein ACFCGT_08430 [Sandaracinaceae bacterium]
MADDRPDDQDPAEAQPAADEERRDAEAEGPTASERRAQDELASAIDHLRAAASLLFERAAKDPAVKSATREAERAARQVGDGLEPVARQVTSELGKLTKGVLEAVDGVTRPRGSRGAPPPAPRSEEEQEAGDGGRREEGRREDDDPRPDREGPAD